MGLFGAQKKPDHIRCDPAVVGLAGKLSLRCASWRGVFPIFFLVATSSKVLPIPGGAAFVLAVGVICFR